MELELDALAVPASARDDNTHDVVLGARERAVFAVSAVLLDEEGLVCLAVVLPLCLAVVLPSTVLTVVAVLAVLAGFNVIPSCSSRTEQVGTR